MAKEKKPLVDIEIECPECKSELKVTVKRERTNPAEPPDYEYDVDVGTVKQGNFFKKLPAKGAKVAKTG